MKYVLIMVLCLIIGAFLGNHIISQNRVCLDQSFFDQHSKQVTITLLNTGASILSVKLDGVPDLSGFTEEHDAQFQKQLSQLSPQLIFTNIEELQKSSAYTWSQLGNGGRSYAQEHMIIYIKDISGNWFSIIAPTYC